MSELPTPDDKRAIWTRDCGKRLKEAEGTYLWSSVEGAPLYVGSTELLRNRTKMHLGPKAAIAAELAARGALHLSLWFRPAPERWELEELIWEQLRPALNKLRPHHHPKHRTQRKRGSLQRAITPEMVDDLLRRAIG